MKKARCSNCSHEISAFESATYGLRNIFFGGGVKQSAFADWFANMTEVRCPKCGCSGRWLES